MNKKALTVMIVGIIILGTLLKNKITFDYWNLITVLYYVAVMAVAIVAVRYAQRGNKNFWKWLLVYISFFLAITAYFYFKA